MRAQSFLYGFTLPGQAFKKIIASRRLIFWSSLPLLITLLLYGVFVTEVALRTRGLMEHSLATWGLDSNGWLFAILIFFTKVLLFFVGAITFSLVANTIACPLNDFLAEAAEAHTVPLLPAVQSLTIWDRVRCIGIDLLRTFLGIGVTLVALLFSWIPFLNVASVLLTFLVISFQFVGYPQVRRGEGIQEGVHFVTRHLFACLGFGAAFTFLFSIPIVSSFCLPLAVVGGTMLAARAKGNAQLPMLK